MIHKSSERPDFPLFYFVILIKKDFFKIYVLNVLINGVKLDCINVCMLTQKASAIFSTSYFNDIPFHKLCSSNEITNRIYGYQIKTQASFLEK